MSNEQPKFKISQLVFWRTWSTTGIPGNPWMIMVNRGFVRDFDLEGTEAIVQYVADGMARSVAYNKYRVKTTALFSTWEEAASEPKFACNQSA